jgi:dinuclear metal center YbgI/SA1388 family protein
MYRQELENYTQQLLDTGRFKDYCPNGLQVEGRKEIRHIVTGVTANMALLEAAAAAGADAVLVHHGFFWKNEDSRVIGIKQRRLKFLLQHDLNLFAWHLPLDAHPTLGNNVQLAEKLGINIEGWFGEQNLACIGKLQGPMPIQQFAALIETRLQRPPLLVGATDKTVSQVALCSGGAQGYFLDACNLGVNVFITGEISEAVVHTARESGVAYIAAGHHATERYGIQALGAHLANRFGLSHQHIDIDSPA